jgi:hypothetical protein
MHAIYGFHVPAFVLISGYVSGDLNPKRRRALIGGIGGAVLLQDCCVCNNNLLCWL